MFHSGFNNPLSPPTHYPLLAREAGAGKREEEEVPNKESRRLIGFRFEELKGQEWGWQG